ncbi:leucine-rich repeat extensin-like protein 2 [Miscanthus floridulus]|uniref:leucine-rich repeat extensin-like protein 2 n=1 Tax=Miscanthus floridulus TaxID=154761 RepID=UPI00345904D8
MSSPLPSSSHLPSPHTHPPPRASLSALLPHTAGAPALGALASSGALAPSALAPSALVLTPEQMTAAILELGQAVAGIRAFLVGPYVPQPQPQLPPPPPPHQQQLPPPPPPSAATTAPVISYQYGMPYDGTATTSFPAALRPSQGVPIQQNKFPLSPSPLPAWIAGSSKPIYTAPSPQPHLPPHPTTGAVMAPGGAPTSGILYGGVDDPPVPRQQPDADALRRVALAGQHGRGALGRRIEPAAAQVLQVGVRHIRRLR